MSDVNLKRKPLAVSVGNQVATMQIDTTGDNDLFEQEDFIWDDLIKLKDDIASEVIKFSIHLHEAVSRPDVMSNLGDMKDEFEQTVMIYGKDIQNFSNKVKAVFSQHEHKTGKVTDMDDYNLYNRLSIEYQAMYCELIDLMNPTLSKLMILIAEIVPDAEPEEVQEVVSETFEEKQTDE